MLGSNNLVRREIMRAHDEYINNIIISEQKNKNDLMNGVIEYINSIGSLITQNQSTNPKADQATIDPMRLRARIMIFLFKEIVRLIYKPTILQKTKKFNGTLREKLEGILKKKISYNLKEKLNDVLVILIIIDSSVDEETKYSLSKYEKLCLDSSYYTKILNSVSPSNQVRDPLLSSFLKALKEEPACRKSCLKLVQSMQSYIAELEKLAEESKNNVLSLLQDRSNCEKEFDDFVLSRKVLSRVYDVSSEASNKQLVGRST